MTPLTHGCNLIGGTQASCSSADRSGVCPWTPQFQVWHLQKKVAVRGGHVGSSCEVPGAVHCGWVTLPCLPAPAPCSCPGQWLHLLTEAPGAHLLLSPCHPQVPLRLQAQLLGF